MPRLLSALALCLLLSSGLPQVRAAGTFYLTRGEAAMLLLRSAEIPVGNEA